MPTGQMIARCMFTEYIRELRALRIEPFHLPSYEKSLLFMGLRLGYGRNLVSIN